MLCPLLTHHIKQIHSLIRISNTHKHKHTARYIQILATYVSKSWNILFHWFVRNAHHTLFFASTLDHFLLFVRLFFFCSLLAMIFVWAPSYHKIHIIISIFIPCSLARERAIRTKFFLIVEIVLCLSASLCTVFFSCYCCCLLWASERGSGRAWYMYIYSYLQTGT